MSEAPRIHSTPGAGLYVWCGTHAFHPLPLTGSLSFSGCGSVLVRQCPWALTELWEKHSRGAASRVGAVADSASVIQG